MTRKWKQNAVEKTIAAGIPKTRTPDTDLTRFWRTEYGWRNIRLITTRMCNSFWAAIDASGANLFVKSGRHSGLYENEYQMARALYDLNQDNFLRPVCYRDYDENQFVAMEFAAGPSLTTAICTNMLSGADKARMIADLWRIFCALRASDVVHRDVRPDNFMIWRGHLVLIDFQLAVSKSNYHELDYFQEKPTRLRNLGNRRYRRRQFMWDDAYSMMRVMEYIGYDKSYAMRWRVIYNRIRATVGDTVIVAPKSLREGFVRRTQRHARKLLAKF